MPYLQDKAKAALDYIISKIPVKVRTVFSVRAMPHSIASSLDVDTVHRIIKAAQNGDTLELFQLYADVISAGSHIQGRISDRKEAVLSDTLSVQPVDKKNADDIKAADAIRDMLADFPADCWEKAISHALDSFLWPVAIMEKTYRPSTKPGLRYELDALTPVPHVLITFIHGKLELRDTDPATGLMLASTTEPDDSRYIQHRGHLLTGVPDNWGGPMRSLLFWWLLMHMSRDWWARFLDRYGSPFMVGKYNQADDDSRSVLQSAFAYCTKIGGLVISKETEVEIKQAAASDSGEAYKTFIELCNREISKLILGETLSSDAQATGMNSGNSKAQGDKRDEKRSGDARRQAATLRNGLFKQYLQINGIAGRPPLPIWGSVSADEQAAMADVLDSLAGAGLEVADEALPIISERFGLPVQRKAAPEVMPGGPISAFSATLVKKNGSDSVDLIAEAGAVDLAAVFPGELAPLQGIIANAESADQAMKDVLAFCARFEPGKSARVIEDAMLAMAVNGCVEHAR